jgi:hypothetical protein
MFFIVILGILVPIWLYNATINKSLLKVNVLLGLVIALIKQKIITVKIYKQDYYQTSDRE